MGEKPLLGDVASLQDIGVDNSGNEPEDEKLDTITKTSNTTVCDPTRGSVKIGPVRGNGRGTSGGATGYGYGTN